MGKFRVLFSNLSVFLSQFTFAALAERKSEISEIRQNGSLNLVSVLETYILKNWKPYALPFIFEISIL